MPQKADRHGDLGRRGKGETVVQETTSDPGDRIGSVNPTRSKSRQCASEGGPPEHTGRTLEVVGNGDPRWMAVTPVRATGPGDRTRLTGRLIPFPSRHVPKGVTPASCAAPIR